MSIENNAFKHLLALSIAFEMCSPKVNFESKVTPRYFTDFDNSMICSPFFNGTVGIRRRLLLNGKIMACVLPMLILIFHLMKYACSVASEMFSLLTIVFDCFADV